MADVTLAFKRWMKRSSIMPTPKDIFEEVESICAERAARPTGPAPKPKPRNTERFKDFEKRIRREIPWFGMSWNEIQEAGMMPLVEKHLANLTREKGAGAAQNYMKFLKGE